MSRHDDDGLLWLWLLFSKDSEERPSSNDDGLGCGFLLVILAIIILFFA